ncbi:hypothetical protein BH11VER1_BH11VER1_25270 [soil metagenome]
MLYRFMLCFGLVPSADCAPYGVRHRSRLWGKILLLGFLVLVHDFEVSVHDIALITGGLVRSSIA